MKISYNWLQTYLRLDFPIGEIASLLTDIGLEVESVEEVESIRGGLKGVVIGEVITKKKHPNADRLNLTTVDIGQGKVIQIVCGAPNVDVGQKVPVATVGTWLYDGEDKFKIKKGKIRGEESVGMICAEYELGLGKDNEGIMILENDALVGMKASEYFKLESDFIFDIALTPNRSDAMSHIGVARDLMTRLNHKGMQLQMCIPLVDDFKVISNKQKISVEVKDSALCPRYTGITISNVKVEESPNWLQNRLRSIGLTPINNIVDITNYILHETGQPLHAFDYNKISEKKVLVSTVKDKTKFITLDNVERELSNEDLIISSAKDPLCIAGVFGGINSGVTNDTTDIFLESAYFDPISIRKTAKRHGLSTDASFRFERGCDPNITIYALKRASIMISDICEGIVSSQIIDIYPEKISHHEVTLDYNNMQNLIGEHIDSNIVKSILQDLGIQIQKEKKDGLNLLVPPFKVDVTREVDVIEEVLRIYGLNTVKIPNKMKPSFMNSSKLDSPYFVNLISDLLSNNGFNEIMNNSLTKSSYDKLISDLEESESISILNPLSNDLDVMRQSLLFGGLENIIYNQNRKNINLKFYEFGKTYHKNKDQIVEKEKLQLFVSGNIQDESWNTGSKKVDFYYLKERVNHILSFLNISNFKSENIDSYGFSEGLMYSYQGKRLVCFGKLEEDLCQFFGIKEDVYSADFNWNLIIDLVKLSSTVTYKDINRFPEVRRDLSLLIDTNVSFENILKVARNRGIKVIKSINLFDVYEGKELPKGKKSYAVSFILADETKTLTDVYIDKIMHDLIESFQKELSAEIR